MRVLGNYLAVLLASAPAAAQPDADLDDAQRDAIAKITEDPAVRGLLTEGARQRQARAYEQALANFLEAYAKVPSPRILLDIASTLREMGRLADAANTYSRYLLDPRHDATRATEIEDVVARLDEQLTTLTVHVTPPGSEVSIDAGAFVAVGKALRTRVRPGIHLVRVRRGAASTERSINGFEGERKDVAIEVPLDAPPPPDPELDRKLLTMPDQLDGWLITGTQYSGSDGRERKVRTGPNGVELPARMPPRDEDVVTVVEVPADGVGAGAIGVVRIDGKARGAAFGVGLAISRRHLEGELMYLRSELSGAYLGVRARLRTGTLRPYLGAGVPAFVYDEMEATGAMASKLAIGLRAAAGLEVRIHQHLSAQVDVGYEHFFVAEDGMFEDDMFVPTVGVIGRL